MKTSTKERTETDYRVADISLADFGRKEISIAEKEMLFLKRLIHPGIKFVRSAGLLIAVEFENFEINKRVIDGCLRNGLLTDWFLFASGCLRIAPPLTVTLEEIEEICRIILENAEEYGK